MNWIPFALLLLAIVTGVAGQLFLKRGMSRRPGFRLNELARLAGDPYILGGFFCYGASVLLYFGALAGLELSLAYPTVSLGYVLATILSRWLFLETVSATRWAAIIVICIGVALVGLGTS